MKVKLLKKVRKRFEVLYYPKGIERCKIDSNEIIHLEEKFLIVNNSMIYDYSLHKIHKTKNEALEEILRVTKRQYEGYSRKYNQQQLKNKTVKVWHEK